jgi:hypothetical protein
MERTTSCLHADEESMKEFERLAYDAITEQGYFHIPEITMRRKDETLFPTEQSVIPLVDDAGEWFGWINVVRDIAEPKNTEYSLLQSEKSSDPYPQNYPGIS